MTCRVLVVHPSIRPHGGGQTVAAWTLQALRGTCDLSLVTWDDVDYDGVNRTFGTTLRSGDFRVHRCPLAWRLLAATVPGNLDLLRVSVLARQAKRLDVLHRYDVVLSTHNEIDVGRRAIQYVHYPHAYTRPPRSHYRWFHRPPGLIASYRLLCDFVSPVDLERVGRNLTIANSRFIAARVSQVYGISPIVIQPPVPGGFPDIPWHARENGIVCLGRLAPVKQLTDAVDLVDRVRARGHDVRLYIIGTPEDARYEARLRGLAQTRADWMTLHINLTRQDMTALAARQRYALHPQVGEPFGIAVAELLVAGCVTFVAAPGGPVEIVGDEPALVFATPAEAVDRIDAVLRDAAVQDRLRHQLAARRELFSAERFVHEMRHVVAHF
jgi:glycosyltransferase involved in cell wall biosynthesis